MASRTPKKARRNLAEITPQHGSAAGLSQPQHPLADELSAMGDRYGSSNDVAGVKEEDNTDSDFLLRHSEEEKNNKLAATKFTTGEDEDEDMEGILTSNDDGSSEELPLVSQHEEPQNDEDDNAAPKQKKHIKDRLSFPSHQVSIPAGTSLRDICQNYPNHLTQSGLDPFIGVWSARKIFENMPEAIKNKSTSKNQKANFMQKRLSRRKHELLIAGRYNIVLWANKQREGLPIKASEIARDDNINEGEGEEEAEEGDDDHADVDEEMDVDKKKASDLEVEGLDTSWSQSPILSDDVAAETDDVVEEITHNDEVTNFHALDNPLPSDQLIRATTILGQHSSSRVSATAFQMAELPVNTMAPSQSGPPTSGQQSRIVTSQVNPRTLQDLLHNYQQGTDLNDQGLSVEEQRQDRAIGHPQSQTDNLALIVGSQLDQYADPLSQPTAAEANSQVKFLLHSHHHCSLTLVPRFTTLPPN